jgi:hypothetical protein
MTTIPRESARVAQETKSWSSRILDPEMWVSSAIAVIWHRFDRDARRPPMPAG